MEIKSRFESYNEVYNKVANDFVNEVWEDVLNNINEEDRTVSDVETLFEFCENDLENQLNDLDIEIQDVYFILNNMEYDDVDLSDIDTGHPIDAAVSIAKLVAKQHIKATSASIFLDKIRSVYTKKYENNLLDKIDKLQDKINKKEEQYGNLSEKENRTDKQEEKYEALYEELEELKGESQRLESERDTWDTLVSELESYNGF